MTAHVRALGRADHELRPLSFETGFSRYAEGSVLVRAGETHVLCTASVEESVPGWMKGQGTGWVSAEYSMLPRATHTRGKRDREKVSGRTQEIQRLIGRGLRAMVDLKGIGERSILIDCDVLQADGGTRCASISGACVALGLALGKLAQAGKIPSLKSAMVDTVSAISVGLHGDRVLTDVDYVEDSSGDVDMNFVITGRGGLVEVQGTGEKRAFGKPELDAMLDRALAAGARIRDAQLKALASAGVRF